MRGPTGPTLSPIDKVSMAMEEHGRVYGRMSLGRRPEAQMLDVTPPPWEWPFQTERRTKIAGVGNDCSAGDRMSPMGPGGDACAAQASAALGSTPSHAPRFKVGDRAIFVCPGHVDDGRGGEVLCLSETGATIHVAQLGWVRADLCQKVAPPSAPVGTQTPAAAPAPKGHAFKVGDRVVHCSGKALLVTRCPNTCCRYCPADVCTATVDGRFHGHYPADEIKSIEPAPSIPLSDLRVGDVVVFPNLGRSMVKTIRGDDVTFTDGGIDSIRAMADYRYADGRAVLTIERPSVKP